MSQSQGPNNPTIGATDTSVGTDTWFTPEEIASEDGQVAATAPNGVTRTTHYLKASGFNFTVPSGATIEGIVIEIKRRIQLLDGLGSAADNRVRIIKGGAIGATERAALGNWPSVLTYATYGSPSDLWGETWAPADINSSDFGVALSATVTAQNSDDARAQVDHVRCTVHYTEAAPEAISTGPGAGYVEAQQSSGPGVGAPNAAPASVPSGSALRPTMPASAGAGSGSLPEVSSALSGGGEVVEL